MVPHFSIYMISNNISQLFSENGNFCLLMLEILIFWFGFQIPSSQIIKQKDSLQCMAQLG